MSKIIWIILFTSILDAKILQVKQLFNIQKVAVKKISFEEKRTFYATTEIDDSRVRAIALRYDFFINHLYANKIYQYIEENEALFNIYSKEVMLIHDDIRENESDSTVDRKFLLEKEEEEEEDAIRLLELFELQAVAGYKSILYDFDVSSPISGHIIELNVVEGGFGKSGELLMKLADLTDLWVLAKVYQKDINFVKKGMKATLDIEGFDSKEIVVDEVYPVVDPVDRSISVRFLLENHDVKYLPGLFAKVHLKKEIKRILSLPKTAVLQKEKKYYVFVPVGSEGQFEPKEIQAKRLNTNKYEIISGLKEGDTVIDNALFMLDSDAITNALYDSFDDDDW